MQAGGGYGGLAATFGPPPGYGGPPPGYGGGYGGDPFGGGDY